ncbi:hypothetical protein JW992_04275 [candidate division KSB1 bacterium]|nr:hypothetical protein [candidate division KSB1 bacterium]
MKYLVTAIVLFSFLGIQSTSAQIQFTADDLNRFVNSTHTVQIDTTESIAVNVGVAGANRLYDFSGLNLSGVSIANEFLLAGQTPFAGQFPTATHAVKMILPNSDEYGFLYNYMRVNASGIQSLGTVYASNDNQFEGMEGDDEFIPLPLVYNNRWQSVEADTFSFGGVSSITTTRTDHHIDGWGKVKLAFGEYDCLRWRQDVTTISATSAGGYTVPIDSFKTIEYSYIGKNSFYFASISSMEDEENPQFTQASDVSLLVEAPTLTSVRDDHRVVFPDEFVLLPGYPNPFNPNIRLRFHLPQNQHVRLQIVNSLGQIVRVLVDGTVAAGLHESLWDGRDRDGRVLSSGNYRVVLQSADERRVQTVTLIK